MNQENNPTCEPTCESEHPYSPLECAFMGPCNGKDTDDNCRDLNRNILELPFIRWYTLIVYDNALKHGFHNHHTSMEHNTVMIITELCEAVNAHRARETFPQNLEDVIHIAIEDKKIEPNTSLDSFYSDLEKRRASVIGAYEEYILGTFPDELADAYIRCLDYIAYHQLNNMLTGQLEFTYGPAVRMKFESKLRGLSLPHMIGVILEYFYNIQQNQFYQEEKCIIKLLIGIWAIANIFEIHLKGFIEAKILYNANRPMLHGKQY